MHIAIIGNAGFYAAASIAGNAFSFSLTSYLIGRYNMKQNAATNVNNIFSGTYNFSPVIGAFVADAFWGRFRTLLVGTVFGVAVSFCLACCFWTKYNEDRFGSIPIPYTHTGNGSYHPVGECPSA